MHITVTLTPRYIATDDQSKNGGRWSLAHDPAVTFTPRQPQTVRARTVDDLHTNSPVTSGQSHRRKAKEPVAAW